MVRGALPVHAAGPHGDRHRRVGGGVPDSASGAGSGVHRAGVCHGDWRVPVRRLRAGAPAAARPGQPVAADMADHAHGPVAKKVMVAVGGQGIDAEVVRLACSMTDAHGKLYGVHIIEVNRSLPLGAVMDEVVERGEKILDEVEQLATEAQLNVETELVQARDTGPALVDEAVEWGAELLVMGLPYKRRFGEFNLGKTVPYVLKNANCRVLLFREHREHQA
ncbi:MAG: universal stress protein [Chloroflexi bacterium]|nr:MAG: universal stress protein [Chloroflexota bacterium]